jgi:hypothetical protein
MNRGMEQKIAAFKKMAAPQEGSVPASHERTDSLANIVRSKKDGEELMAEIESVVARARQKRG